MTGNTDNLQRFEVRFTGRVQGVYFRATTREIADRFDVTGSVRNEVDGSVSLVAEGSPSELESFLDAVCEAKSGNIDDVTINRSRATGEFTGFSIAR